MAIVSEQTSKMCNHCNRHIPSTNIDLHLVHCSRNLEKCKVCGEMVPRKNARDHYVNNHAPVSCSMCSETMERDILDVHKGERCPQRIATCEFCEFPLPAIDLVEHQEVCGNRTERCHHCNKYIMLRNSIIHETTCNGIVHASRDERPAAGRGMRPAFLQGRNMVISIAVTGMAIILGSMVFQKKSGSNPSR